MNLIDLVLAGAALPLEPPSAPSPVVIIPLPVTTADEWHDAAFFVFCSNVAEFFGLDCRDVVSLVAASPEYIFSDRPCTAAHLAWLGNCVGEALGAPPSHPLFTIALH